MADELEVPTLRVVEPLTTNSLTGESPKAAQQGGAGLSSQEEGAQGVDSPRNTQVEGCGAGTSSLIAVDQPEDLTEDTLSGTVNPRGGERGVGPRGELPHEPHLVFTRGEWSELDPLYSETDRVAAARVTAGAHDLTIMQQQLHEELSLAGAHQGARPRESLSRPTGPVGGQGDASSVVEYERYSGPGLGGRLDSRSSHRQMDVSHLPYPDGNVYHQGEAPRRSGKGGKLPPRSRSSSRSARDRRRRRASVSTETLNPRDTGYLSSSEMHGLVPESRDSGAPLGRSDRPAEFGGATENPELVHPRAVQFAEYSGDMLYPGYDTEEAGVRSEDRQLSHPTLCEAGYLGESRPAPRPNRVQGNFLQQGEGAWRRDSNPYQSTAGSESRFQAGATRSVGPQAQSTPFGQGGVMRQGDHLVRDEGQVATQGHESLRVRLSGRHSEAEFEPSAEPMSGYNRANQRRAAIGYDEEECRPRAGQGYDPRAAEVPVSQGHWRLPAPRGVRPRASSEDVGYTPQALNHHSEIVPQGGNPQSAEAVAASAAAMQQMAMALTALRVEMSPRTQPRHQPAARREESPWGGIGAQGQGDGDRGDSYAVIIDPRGSVNRRRNSARRSRSSGYPEPPPPPRRDCSHSSSSSSEGDSGHSSRRYQGFNRSTCRRDEVKVRVGDYKGGSDALSLPMFFIEFEDAAEIAEWSYKRKGQELRTRLKGPALMAVQALTEGGQSTDYNALTKSLCAEFLPPSATVRAHMQLNSCVQGDKSVGTYGSHLRRLAMLAYPPGSSEGHAAVRDRRALDRFVVTLSQGTLRVKVLEGKPKSLRQAINIAEEYMAILDPNGDGSGGDLQVAAPAYPVQAGVLRSDPQQGGHSPGAQGDVNPTGHQTTHTQGNPGAESKECMATKAIHELTHAFQRFTPAPAEEGEEREVKPFRRQSYAKGKPAQGQAWKPRGVRKCDSKCFRCQKLGHFARECPTTGTAVAACMDSSCNQGVPHACFCASCHFPSGGSGSHPN